MYKQIFTNIFPPVYRLYMSKDQVSYGYGTVFASACIYVCLYAVSCHIEQPGASPAYHHVDKIKDIVHMVDTIDQRRFQSQHQAISWALFVVKAAFVVLSVKSMFVCLWHVAKNWASPVKYQPHVICVCIISMCFI